MSKSSGDVIADEGAVRSREIWLDVAKGVGICLVVFGHATNGLISAGILPAIGTITDVYYIIYTFHMPLFFFLAGFTADRSLRRGRHRFLTDKLLTIAYPYVIWSVLQGLSQAVLSDSLNHPFRLDYLYGIYIQPIGQFWFLYVLMIYHVIVAMLCNHRAFIITGGVLSLIGYSFLDGLPFSAAHFFAFYAAGVLLNGRTPWRIAAWPYMGAAGIAVLAAFIGLAAVSAPFTGWNSASPLCLPIAGVGILGTILISNLPSEWALSGIMAYFGRQALPIYLMHVMAAAGTRVVLMKLGITQDPITLLILCTLAGLLLPLAAVAVFSRLGLLEALGLARMRARRFAGKEELGLRVDGSR
jgi:fucose 4-O-acetylase-like acetyltransferase